MDTGLDGRVAVVTGASRGIGFATARRLAAEGARVVLSSRKAEALDAAIATIAEDVPGAEVVRVAANAGAPDAADAVVAAALDAFGAIDVVVNNAATNPYHGPALDISTSQWDKTFDVNLRGVHALTRAAARAGMAERGGSIVNVASVGGLITEPGIGIYNVTKAAVMHLTRTLAAELGPTIRVNAVAPGLVKTDMARALWEEHGDAIARHLPLGRLGEPDDIADAICFLAGSASSWITGATLVVDGGALTRG